MEIIYQINDTLIKEFKKKGFNDFDIDPYRIVINDLVHMANLAIYVGFSVNGVAELHTQILKDDTFKHWYKIFPIITSKLSAYKAS